MHSDDPSLALWPLDPAAAASASQLGDCPSPETLALALRPRSSARVSSEVYGFVLWMSSFVLAALWMAWATLPEETLHGVGWTYYPDRSDWLTHAGRLLNAPLSTLASLTCLSFFLSCSC